jgi:hypothetical protein
MPRDAITHAQLAHTIPNRLCLPRGLRRVSASPRHAEDIVCVLQHRREGGALGAFCARFHSPHGTRTFASLRALEPCASGPLPRPGPVAISGQTSPLRNFGQISVIWV